MARTDLRPLASETVQMVYKDYVQGAQILQTPMVFLNNRPPIRYWADGRLRFNVFVPERKRSSRDWKTLYRSAVTRNKCLGIIAHLIGMSISPSIQAQNDAEEEDMLAAQFLRDTVEWSQEHESFQLKLFWALVTAVAEGTVILEDNYGEFTRKVKDITSWDTETGKMKWDEKKITEFVGAYTDIVPNDELLIPNPFITSIQEQPWVIRRRRMTMDQARRFYSHYKNFDAVRPGTPESWTYTSDYFQPYTSVTTLSKDTVEVVTRYEKDGDKMDIVANGVQLTDEGTPMPRKDKEYPFAKSGYEPIDYSFFWYKSLTDKMAPEQDVYDTVLRMIIDRQHLENLPPLKTNSPALVNEEIIIPGNTVYTGNTDGMKLEPIMPPYTAQSGASALLGTMQENMNLSSIDPMQTGGAPTGGTPTATQALQQAVNARIMLGLFGWMIGTLIMEWTKLRMNTIIWRVATVADLPKITIADRVLRSGKIGKRSYLFERGLGAMDEGSKRELSRQIDAFEQGTDGKEEVVGLDPEEMSKLSYYVKIDAQLKPRRTDELMQALAMEKWQIYSARPDVFNVNLAATKLAQAWGDDPDDMVLPAQQPMPGMPVGSGLSGETPIMDQLNKNIAMKLGTPSAKAAQNALAV